MKLSGNCVISELSEMGALEGINEINPTLPSRS